MKEKINQRGFIQLPILAIIFAVILVGAGGTFVYREMKDMKKEVADIKGVINKSVNPTPTPEITSSPEIKISPTITPNVIKNNYQKEIINIPMPSPTPTPPTNSLKSWVMPTKAPIVGSVQEVLNENLDFCKKVASSSGVTIIKVNQSDDYEAFFMGVGKNIPGEQMIDFSTSCIKYLNVSDWNKKELSETMKNWTNTYGFKIPIYIGFLVWGWDKYEIVSVPYNATQEMLDSNKKECESDGSISNFDYGSICNGENIVVNCHQITDRGCCQKYFNLYQGEQIDFSVKLNNLRSKYRYNIPICFGLFILGY
jgi:hypothetical protein